MLKSCHVVNSLSSSCLLLAKNADQRKTGWNDQQTSLATCMTEISELGLEQCSSPGWSDHKCQKMCLRRRIQRLYCLDEWIILISISELCQEVGRICMLRTGIKGSAVDFLQVGTTTLAIYFTMLAFYCVHLLWAILFWKLCQLHWYGANATSKEDKCISKQVIFHIPKTTALLD